MLQDRKQEDRNIKLPKQAALPTLKQVQDLVAEATKITGRTIHLPFGEAPEEYYLTVFRDRAKGDLNWSLYRSEGSDSFMEWSHVCSDAGFIHNLITAQFPGAALKPVALGGTQPVVLTGRGEGALNRKVADDQFATLKMRSKPTLEGDLENLELSNLLQTIAMGKKTGRLDIEGVQDPAVIYFADGAPIHCSMRGVEGDAALVELVGWSQGEFRFYQEPRIDQHTVKRRLDQLLMEGAALQDQTAFLDEIGLTMECYIIRNHASISEALFEQMLAQGTGADMKLQKNLYQAVDNKNTLLEILRRLPYTKSQWVPSLFNMVTCGLLSFAFEPPESTNKNKAGDEAEIAEQARNIEKLLLRPDTGLYTYPAFLFFLEKEYLRYERFSHPMSVILMEIGLKPFDPNALPEPLPLAGVREVRERINKLKRKTDILAHYETLRFALLLPETESQAAKSFANRLAEILMSSPLADGGLGRPMVASVGVASIPEDCQALGVLLSKAKPPKTSIGGGE